MKVLAFVALIVITALNIWMFAALHSSASGLDEGYADGIYRGAFLDKNQMEVGVEFKLVNNHLEDIKFRYLHYSGTDYLSDTSEHSEAVRSQFFELLNFLKGKRIMAGVAAIYAPGEIVTQEYDGLTGATLRAGKLVSAIRDALNRGPYSLLKSG